MSTGETRAVAGPPAPPIAATGANGSLDGDALRSRGRTTRPRGRPGDDPGGNGDGPIEDPARRERDADAVVQRHSRSTGAAASAAASGHPRAHRNLPSFPSFPPPLPPSPAPLSPPLSLSLSLRVRSSTRFGISLFSVPGMKGWSRPSMLLSSSVAASLSVRPAGAALARVTTTTAAAAAKVNHRGTYLAA